MTEIVPATVYGRPLYAHARQKCLEEGVLVSESDPIWRGCVESVTKGEIEGFRSGRKLMRKQTEALDKLIKEKRPDKDTIWEAILSLEEISGKQVQKYDDDMANQISTSVVPLMFTATIDDKGMEFKQKMERLNNVAKIYLE